LLKWGSILGLLWFFGLLNVFFWDFANLMGQYLCFQKFGHIYKGYLVEDEKIFGKMQQKNLIRENSIFFSKIGYVCLIQDNTLG
jgi:hypothetical protein